MTFFLFFFYFFVKFTLFLFFFFYFLQFFFYFLQFFFDIYIFMDDYFYSQESWGDWNIDFKDVTEDPIFFMWDTNISSISDEFWNFWDDSFYPEDNYLYPEFRYFFIYSTTIQDIWN